MPNTGFLGWAYISGSGIAVDSGVADKQVLFMSGSDVISGSSAFQYNYNTDTLSVDTVNVVSEIGGDFDVPDGPTFSGTPTFNGSGVVFETNLTVSGSIVQGTGSTEIANVFVTDVFSLLGPGGGYFSGEVLDPFPGPPFPFPVLTGYVYYLGSSFVPPAPLTASAVGFGVESFLAIPLGADISNGFLYRGFFNYDVLGTSVKNALLSSSSGTGSLTSFKQIFADPTRPGGITTVVPSTAGHVVRCLGHSVGTASIYFNPSPDFIEL
jgi:hypothetical protein